VGFGLPAAARVRDGRDFRRIYRHGSRARGRRLIVVGLRRNDPGFRVGLSVSKDHGGAVRRNKIKRLLREAFRLERPTLPGAFDLVLIPRPVTSKLSLPELRAELRALVEQLVHKPRPNRPAQRPRRRPPPSDEKPK